MSNPNVISETRAMELFDSHLDRTIPPVIILKAELAPSEVIKSLDYASYRFEFKDWLIAHSDLIELE